MLPTKSLLFALLAAGCGSPTTLTKGFIFDDSSAPHASAVERLVELEAEEFKRPQWGRELSEFEIDVMSIRRLVPCGDETALGCTIYSGNDEPIIMRTVTAAFLENTAIPHELIHVYAATVLGDEDPTHTKFPATWDAGERALHRFEAEVGGPRREAPEE